MGRIEHGDAPWMGGVEHGGGPGMGGIEHAQDRVSLARVRLGGIRSRILTIHDSDLSADSCTYGSIVGMERHCTDHYGRKGDARTL